MKKILFLLAAAAVTPTFAAAQSSDAEIQRAEATVVSLRPDGATVVLRQGTSGIMCWDNTVRAGNDGVIDSQCTTEANRARLEQNHAFQSAGGSEEEVNARFAAAEANGSRASSEFGSIYYHVTGDSPETIRSHTTVAVPFATAESMGLPEQGGPARLWLMQAGTSSAHLMVSGI